MIVGCNYLQKKRVDMKKKLIYRTVLNQCPLCYQETKRINQLLLSGSSTKEIENAITNDNILQLPSLDRRKRVGNEIIFRLNEVGIDTQMLIQSEDLQTSKSLVIYSILQVDLLFLEFVRGVYLEKILTFRHEITKKEVRRFIEKQIENNEKAQTWSEKTIKELTSTFLRILVEGGFIQKINSDTYQIQRMVLSLEVEKFLREKGYKPVAEILLGELL